MFPCWDTTVRFPSQLREKPALNQGPQALFSLALLSFLPSLAFSFRSLPSPCIPSCHLLFRLPPSPLRHSPTQPLHCFSLGLEPLLGMLVQLTLISCRLWLRLLTLHKPFAECLFKNSPQTPFLCLISWEQKPTRT